MGKYTRSFITGSWAYGTPRLEDDICIECGQNLPDVGSDVDLVVLVTEDDLATLFQASDKSDPAHLSGSPDSVSLRFGKLNLICELRDNAFWRWKMGTKTLQLLGSIRGRDISREEAVALFERLRKEAGWDGFVNTLDFIKLTARGLRDGIIQKIH